MNYHNIVFCQHEGNPKAFMFECPLQSTLKVGEVVAVDTIRGRSEARVTLESHIVDEDTLDYIVRLHKAYKPLKLVVARRKYIPCDQSLYYGDGMDIPFSDTDEIPF